MNINMNLVDASKLQHKERAYVSSQYLCRCQCRFCAMIERRNEKRKEEKLMLDSTLQANGKRGREGALTISSAVQCSAAEWKALHVPWCPPTGALIISELRMLQMQRRRPVCSAAGRAADGRTPGGTSRCPRRRTCPRCPTRSPTAARSEHCFECAANSEWNIPFQCTRITNKRTRAITNN